MPDLDQIKQGEQGVRDRRGRFARGRSGNPASRPRGCRDRVNRAPRLWLAGEGEAITGKAAELTAARWSLRRAASRFILAGQQIDELGDAGEPSA